MLYGDVGAMESLNSLLKLQTTRTPCIGLDLVDARSKLKKQLGVSATKTAKQDGTARFERKCVSHDCLLQRAADMVREAEQYIDQVPTILNDLERWSRPPTPIDLPGDDEVQSKAAVLVVPKIRNDQSRLSSLMGAS